jgi:hypothetical protein
LEGIWRVIWSAFGGSFGAYLEGHLERIWRVIWSVFGGSFGACLEGHLERIWRVIWSVFGGYFEGAPPSKVLVVFCPNFCWFFL